MPLDLPDRMCCFQPHSLKDVAAHGLDLPQVTWIVQYNPPITAVEYVLVGHTAQIGARGSSLLFLTPSKTTFVDVLANHIISTAVIPESIHHLPLQPETHLPYSQPAPGPPGFPLAGLPGSSQ
ncbi:probable ATP-dependent RNA helicase DDX31 isoform X2 [Myxocyprinus asiaticus]|uniref:probable ATP-dependent RNA helicase DDX31 isoform X2 n=1 Tax=Myxocyprinus asiaticus TaxID=70543 RepID=UPI002222C70C|nr:probable ATP-dependent RNA helicase DDX31 isoform X2 [Myxocyprinus asiaticus]